MMGMRCDDVVDGGGASDASDGVKADKSVVMILCNVDR